MIVKRTLLLCPAGFRVPGRKDVHLVDLDPWRHSVRFPYPIHRDYRRGSGIGEARYAFRTERPGHPELQARGTVPGGDDFSRPVGEGVRAGHSLSHRGERRIVPSLDGTRLA